MPHQYFVDEAKVEAKILKQIGRSLPQYNQHFVKLYDTFDFKGCY
jgi:hypothetical protein